MIKIDQYQILRKIANRNYRVCYGHYEAASPASKEHPDSWNGMIQFTDVSDFYVRHLLLILSDDALGALLF